MKIASLLFTILMAILANSAWAVPFYAKQTGWECSTCHISYPELTETGRQFKLYGYTMGNRTIPFSGMLMAGVDRIGNNKVDPNNIPDKYTKDGQLALSQASLFTGGKILDNLGAFVQWTYDATAHHSAMDNLDLRYADSTTVYDKNLIYGISLNNNPSTQDVFNTTPAWSFPFNGPAGYNPNPIPKPVVKTLIEGGLASNVGGIGPYIDFNDMLYGEFSIYHTANGALSLLRQGVTTANRVLLDGAAPYGRLAYHGSDGNRSWEIGTFGMNAKVHSDNTDTSSPSDKYVDTGIDAQYQIVDGDKRMSFQASLIHQKTTWNSAAVGAKYDNTSDTLNTFKLKGSYFWNKEWGGTLGYFSTTGSTDASFYGTTTGSPDTRGYVAELDYQPFSQLRVSLQYAGYTKFDGSSNGYDATGHKASDNNTVYLSVWTAF